MEQVVHFLQRRNGTSLKLELVFSSGSGSLQGCATAPCASPSSSSSAVAAGQVGPLASPTKGVEVVCFSLQSPPVKSGVGGAPLVSAASPMPKSEDPEHPTTFVAFADGSLVGWNAQWDEMIYIREALRAAGCGAAAPVAASTAGGGGGAPAASSWGGASASAAASPVFPSALSSPTSGSSPAASFVVDSMRYDLFDRLSIAENAWGGDSEPGATVATADSRRNFIQDGEDRIVLAGPAAKYKIPFSYALAQSVKVDAYRREVDPISQEVKRWQQHLAKTGKLLCTLPSLRMVKSKLLSLVELLNFAQYVQTTPKIFWSGEHQLLRPVYRDACVHLEIEARGAALKQMLDSVDESLSYLHDEVHANTNEFLTLVIIFLIAMELSVATGLVHFLARRLMAAMGAADAPHPHDHPPAGNAPASS